LQVHIPGEPVAKGRPRFSRKSGRAYTPATTAKAETNIRACMFAQAGQPMLDGALDVDLVCVMPIPGSWSARKQASARAGVVRPAGRPDLENMVKTVLDAGNGVLWKDDSQVCGLAATKTYGDKPCVILTVRAVA
jgi:Holliday junction resolvase RusA-like endonuclease